nr:MAG TPA: hypothetical protein [Caudoviricetes sp.]
MLKTQNKCRSRQRIDSSSLDEWLLYALYR